MKTPPLRVLVIDDTPAIHDDFRKVFAPAAPLDAELEAMTAHLLGETRPEAAVAELEVALDFSSQGQEGVDLVKGSLAADAPYAVAFVDMRMPPGWDGLETVQQIWKIDPRVQVVICTAHSDHSWTNFQKAIGSTDSLIVLKKPFDQIEAKQLAHMLAQKWRLARENETRLRQLDELVRTRTDELRQAEDRFSHAFAANPHAQALIALEPFEILNVNEAFTQLLGLTAVDLRPHTPESFRRGLDPAKWRALMEKLRRGETVHEHPFRFEREPGRFVDLRCSARAVSIGGRACSIWLLRDVTEQHRLEHQLRQAQKMDALGQLASGIAHDFNNMLTVISSYSDLLLADSPGNEGLGQIREAARRAASLTRQLLVFSRRQIQEPRQLRLSETFQGIRSMLARVIPERIRLEWRVSDEVPVVLADASNLEQAMMNLVINARDATPGPGTITISLSHATVGPAETHRHPKARAGSFAVLSVADTGGGMTPEVQAHLFEPFFTTKSAGNGTGLGLSTVYGIVEQHQGWIEVESKVGHGTTFWIFLPAVEPKSVTTSPFAEPKNARFKRGSGQRLLIVEDDAAVRFVACAIARQAGYVVTEAQDGHQALDAWRAARGFDLVFSDVEMPNGVGGIELATRLRRENPTIKVVLTTGYSSKLLDGARRDLGEVPLLLKPYSPSAMLDMLHATLEAQTPALV